MVVCLPHRWGRHFEARRRRRELIGWSAGVLVISLVVLVLL